jgi:hypothetical protein
VFTPFHKPPYTYPYGRSVDETTTVGVGQNASGARIQAGSAFAGIGDTVAIECVLYDSGFPIVPVDNLWVPAREDPTRFTVVPIGDIHIFIGETNPTPATETNF